MKIDDELLQPCWFLAGPTASGKSAVAMALTEWLPVEIVALDSMTIYRGLDIGTAKPTPADQEQVPHHLIDICDPSDDYSVAEYLLDAERTIRGILQRGRIPLFVGGSGLYLRSLLRGVFDGPTADESLRQRLTDELHAIGKQAFHARLQQVDPVTAARLSPQDVRRVLRALEVWELTGEPISSRQQQPPRKFVGGGPAVFWLEPPRDWLHDRINRRVVEMFSSGWVDEVRQLRQRGVVLGRTASQALGYQEILAWLDRDETDVNPLIADIQTRTRQFAKRQHTWFRNLEECRAIPLTRLDDPRALAQQIIERCDAKSLPTP